MKILACAVIVLSGMSACGGGSSGDSDGSTVLPNVSALAIHEVATPPLRVPNYRTSGTYPQVSSSKITLKAVNAALRDAVLGAQRQYAAYIRRELGPSSSERFRPDYFDHGIYETAPTPRLISASTVLVSALIPLYRQAPGGTSDATWLSLTVRVPSGAPVGIRGLFAEPGGGLKTLAKEVKRKVLFANSCVRQSVKNERAYGFSVRGFDPTVSNYRYFALTARGLAIGFPQGQVGGSSCGLVEATVPYDVLRPYLSELGQRLIAGVRRPKS